VLLLWLPDDHNPIGFNGSAASSDYIIIAIFHFRFVVEAVRAADTLKAERPGMKQIRNYSELTNIPRFPTVGAIKSTRV